MGFGTQFWGGCPLRIEDLQAKRSRHDETGGQQLEIRWIRANRQPRQDQGGHRHEVAVQDDMGGADDFERAVLDLLFQPHADAPPSRIAIHVQVLSVSHDS